MQDVVNDIVILAAAGVGVVVLVAIFVFIINLFNPFRSGH